MLQSKVDILKLLKNKLIDTEEDKFLGSTMPTGSLKGPYNCYPVFQKEVAPLINSETYDYKIIQDIVKAENNKGRKIKKKSLRKQKLPNKRDRDLIYKRTIEQIEANTAESEAEAFTIFEEKKKKLKTDLALIREDALYENRGAKGLQIKIENQNTQLSFEATGPKTTDDRLSTTGSQSSFLRGRKLLPKFENIKKFPDENIVDSLYKHVVSLHMDVDGSKIIAQRSASNRKKGYKGRIHESRKT